MLTNDDRMSVLVNWNALAAALLACLCLSLSWGQEDEGMIVVKQGDTPAGLAAKHLGSPAEVDKLLGFNQIPAGTPLTPGQILQSPKGYILRNQVEKKKASGAISAAREELAPREAAKEFNKALENMKLATGYEAKHEYHLSASYYKQAAFQAKMARQIAVTKLRVPESAKVVAVHNVAEQRPSPTVPWIPCRVGDELDAGAFLRTAKQSKAVLQLSDGSTFSVEPATEVQYVHFVHNKGTGQVNGRIRVVNGELGGDVVPVKHRKSTIELKGPNSSIAVRGTRVRLRTLSGRSDAISLEQGRVTTGAYEAPQLKEVLENGFTYLGEVPANLKTDLQRATGVEVTRKKVGARAKLPGPPTVNGIVPNRVFGTTRIPISLPDRGLKRVEIAASADFLELAVVEETQGKKYTTEPLPAGAYFLRVFAISKQGLVSAPTATIPFTVKPDHRFQLVWDGPMVKQGATYVVNDRTTLGVKAVGEENDIVMVRNAKAGGKPVALKKPFGNFAEDPTTFVLSALNSFGVPKAPVELTVRNDRTPPNLVGKIVDVAGPRGVDQMLRLVPTDDTGVKSVAYRLNGGPERAYTGPIRVSGLNFNVVDARVSDVLGNQRTFRFKFDGRAEAQRGFNDLPSRQERYPAPSR